VSTMPCTCHTRVIHVSTMTYTCQPRHTRATHVLYTCHLCVFSSPSHPSHPVELSVGSRREKFKNSQEPSPAPSVGKAQILPRTQSDLPRVFRCQGCFVPRGGSAAGALTVLRSVQCSSFSQTTLRRGYGIGADPLRFVPVHVVHVNCP
jgi:hypothetical protein